MILARSVSLSLLALACSSAQGPIFATSERFPDSPRRPPSFAAETELPAPADARSASPSGPSTRPPGEPRRLASPLDPDEARAVVSRFFMAVLAESTNQLFPLFASQAYVISEGSRQAAPAMWRARFAQLDYGMLAGRIVAPPQTLRSYTFDSLDRAKRDAVPQPQSPSEVVIVARPSLSWTGKTRLFGDQLAFRLRPSPDKPGFEIAEIVEDFRLP